MGVKQKGLNMEITEKELQQQLDDARKSAVTEYKRTLSKTLKVDVFNEDALSSFITSKVDKAEYEKAVLEKQETETKLKTVSDEYETNLKNYQKQIKEAELVKIENKLLYGDINSKKLEQAKILVKNHVESGLEIDNAVAKVIEENPEWKAQVKRFGTNFNDSPDAKTDWEKQVEKM